MGMTEREKVIQGLEGAVQDIERWIPMFEQHNAPAIIEEAISMLKEQEPVKVKTKCSTGMTYWYTCGECDASVNKGDVYCRKCGRRLVWDEQEKLEKKAAEMYRSQVGEGMGGR